jgi:hypothetical protein
MLHSDEHNHVYSSPDSVKSNHIKMMALVEHAGCVKETRSAHKFLVGFTEGKILFGNLDVEGRICSWIL